MRKLLLLSFLAVGSAFSAPVFQVIPTLGPDFATAPTGDFDSWAANVIANLITPGAPDGSGVAQYFPLSNGVVLTGGEFIESASPSVSFPSGFQSWQGVAPGPYANNYGTALYFSLIITDSVGQFSVSQLSESENFFGNAAGPFGMGTYRPSLVGVNGINVYNNGEADTTLVSALYYVGIGLVQPLDTSIVGTEQQMLDGTKAQMQALLDRNISVCYSLSNSTDPKDGSNCGTASVQAASGIPEPGTMALLGLGLAGVAFLRRRKA